MASNNETNSLLSSSNDKSMSKKHLNEHEETIKSDQMASKKSLSNDGEEQIASMDENDLKNLLDEALTYKNPRDANEKSETFKRLLQNVTEEEEHKRKFESNSLHWKAQSNSLQNLLDESHYQLQNHQSQISSKKHQQRRKNSTSVSTRRLEGGSLPVDMHHSSTIQSPSDQPFLSEFKNNKKRKEKQQAKDTVIDMLDIETDDTRKSFQRCLDPNNKDTTTYQDGMIELKSIHANRVEMEVQDQSSSKFTTANSTPNTITTIASLMTGNPIPTIMSSKSQSTPSTSSVDQVIPFSTLEKPKSYQQAQTMDYYNPSTINHSNNIPLTGGSSSNYGSTSSGPKCVGGSGVVDQQALQLPSGIAVNSVMDPKTFSYPRGGPYKPTGGTRDDVSSLIQTTPSILPTSHSSTTATTTSSNNSKDSKASKKRTAKSERNEKNINVQSIEGYRGNDTLEELLTYIDGQHNNDGKGQKNHPKNGIVSNNSNLSNNNNDKQANEQLLNADDKKKKMVSKNKEKMNKLKKSNSMDELCSMGRQQEKEKSSDVASTVDSSSSSSTANKIVHDVTLRSKNNANNSNSNSNMTSGAKKVENKTDKSQTKRNERRSWGTEGLWPDTSTASTTTNDIINSTIVTGKSANENHDDNQENESSSSSSSSGVHNLDFITSDPINLTSNIESINPSSEADKFQVVIKKKKVKRKSSENNDSKSSVQTTSNNLQSYSMRRDGNFRAGTKSSTSNSNNTNTNNNNNMGENSRVDNKNNAANKNSSKSMSQDAKQNSIGKNRRKSTSSMPDEDNEYSDGGDSVQSLPIETTKPLSSLLSAPNNNNNNNTSAENSGKTNNKKNNNASSFASSNTVVVSQISPSQQQQQIISIQQQQQQKPTTFSYADIAKTNTNRTNNNNNNVIPASTEKMWPSISSSSSSSTHQNNNNNIIINNVNDPFAISSFDAISSRDNSNTNNNNNIIINNNINSLSNTATNLSSSTLSSATITATKQQQVIVNQQQQQQQKSTPPLKNTMSFPDLVESNNNRNKQLNNNPLDLTFNGDATQTEKSLNGLERAFDNNNNPSTIATATTFTTTHDRLNNNNNNNASKISYSQSLLENHNQEIDANGNTSSNNNNNNNTKLENAITVATTVVTSNNSNSNKNTLTKSKSVDHNNLSIEHYPALEKTKQTLSDVLSKPVTKTNLIKVQQQPQQQIQMQMLQNNNNMNMMRATVETISNTTTNVVKDDKDGNGTKKKKDKLALKKSTSTVSTSTMASNQQYSNNIQTQQIITNNSNNNNNHHHNRPAVIILNDCEKSSDSELGITFGFDINEHLLFGHHNGDAVMADMDQNVVEMNSTNKYDKIKNNSNCDIMNTNLSSNTINLNNNLTNQSCGFEIYENNFISSPPQSVIDHSKQQHQQMIHQVTIIQSSPKINSSNNNNNNNMNNSVKENTTLLLDSSNQSLNDLGYMSSSLITNSTTSPANQKISNEMQQHPNSDNVNQYEIDYGHQTSSSYPNAMDIKQHIKLDELISRFVSPEPAKNFNYDELVTFVSEEWTKVERNGVYFNGQ